MGLLWSLVTPLLMLAIYTFVFNFVFQARWPSMSQEGGYLNFAMVLFLGLIIHGLIADTVTRSPTLILENANLVKKVVFPLEILSWVMLLSSAFNFVISLVLLFAFVLWELGSIPATAVWLPVIFLPYFFVLIGMSWIFASMGVYLRDLQQVSGTLSTLFLFMSPVFYSVTILPVAVQPLIYLNPISFVIESSRGVLLYGQAPDLMTLGLYTFVAIAVAFLGHRLFRKMKIGFADVL